MEKVKLTTSEKRVFAIIRKTISYALETKYMFWFTYNTNSDISDWEAISWEGGYDMPLTQQFRNQYTIEDGKQIVKNW